jgi:hypothetical protein
MANKTGALTYDLSGGAQTIAEITISERTEIDAIFVDVSAISAVSAKLRLYNKINGTDYKQIAHADLIAGSTIDDVVNVLHYINASLETLPSGRLAVDSDLKLTIEPFTP